MTFNSLVDELVWVGSFGLLLFAFVTMLAPFMVLWERVAALGEGGQILFVLLLLPFLVFVVLFLYLRHIATNRYEEVEE